MLFALVVLAAAAPARPILGVDPAYMDKKADACRDFWAFANGAYDQEPIPGAYAAFGVNQEIDDRNWDILKGILEGAAADKAAKPGTPAQRIGDFFASGMDEAGIAKGGHSALKPLFAKIDAVKNARGLAPIFAMLHEKGVDAGFQFQVQVDDKNSSAMVAKLWQGGLGLPERDYYFRDDAESKKIRDAYVKHVAQVLALAGSRDSAAAAAQVMALETRLAEASRKLVDLRDPEANYNRTARAALAKDAPGFDFEAYFKAISLPASEKELVVGQPEFVKAFALLTTSVPLADWKTYLRWQLLRAAAPSLSAPFEEASFDFYGRVLSGRTEMLPRWKRVLKATDQAIGEDLGQLYVQKAFSPAAKDRVLAMVKFHLDALRASITRATWMGPETKKQALRKLETMHAKVGYPDRWRDYAALKVSRKSYVENVFAGNAFEFRRGLAKLGKPVDHGEWLMTPQTNNAYYDPTLNEICLPAGILQPPFFDEKADDASNFGALASTIGHELLHGFDDQGAQYDADGNLKNWWTAADKKNYDDATARVVAQYEGYEPLPGMHIEGKQTLGENLADIGGLQIAYDAWKLATAGKPQQSVDGLTAEQRFFVAFAQGWRTNVRPEKLRLQLTSDVHSPIRWRVLGPVSALPAFAKAFSCPADAPMSATEKRSFTIW